MIGFCRGAVVVAWFAAMVATAGCGSGDRNPKGDAGVDAAPDVPDAPAAIDAAVDAPPDTPPVPLSGFDVPYIREITYPRNITGIGGFMVIVNVDTMPLSLAKVEVREVRDDSPTDEVLFELETASATILPPGHGAGRLSQQAAAMLYGRNLLTEPIDDDFAPNFNISFPEKDPFPQVGDIKLTVKLGIGDDELTLPFTLHIGDERSSIILHDADRLPHR